MSASEIHYFQELHTSIHKNKRKKINSNIYFSEKTIKKSKIDLSVILDKADAIFRGFDIKNIDTSLYTIEFIQRNHFDGFWKTSNPLVWHQDDYGLTNRKVYTIIFYIRKDKTVKGGDLEFKLKNENSNNKSNVEIINIVEGDVVCFSGALNHCPTNSSGFGCRDIIVVQYKRN